MRCKKCQEEIVDGDLIHSIPEFEDAVDHTAPMRERYHERCAPAAERVFIHIYSAPVNLKKPRTRKKT